MSSPSLERMSSPHSLISSVALFPGSVVETTRTSAAVATSAASQREGFQRFGAADSEEVCTEV